MISYISVNDPWKPISSNAAREVGNIDPFSPQAQSQLAEFDVLRTQIETKEPENDNELHTNSSTGNNDGKFLEGCKKFLHDYPLTYNNWKKHSIVLTKSGPKRLYKKELQSEKYKVMGGSV